MIFCPQSRIDRFKSAGYWGETTLYQMFEQNADKYPTNTALVDAPNKNQLIGIDSCRFTYAELKDAVDRLATNLLLLGIRKDDIVVAQLPNVTEMVILYLAFNRIGAIISPIAIQNRMHENRNIFNLLKPKAFITCHNFHGFDHLSMAQTLKNEFPSVEAIIGLGPDLPENVIDLNTLIYDEVDKSVLYEYLQQVNVSADDVFTICFTSGTEAAPKAVPRSSNEWICIGSYCHQGCAVFPGYNILNPFPLINMSSIGGMWLPWLFSGGGAFVLHHPFDLQVLLGQIQDEQINYTLIPPAVLNMLLQNEQILAQYDISSVKSIGSGSAPLSPWMVRGFQEKYGIKVYNVFGSTEGISFMSSFDDPEERAIYFPRWGVEGFTWEVSMPDMISAKIAPGSLKSKIVDPVTKETITEPGIPGEMCIDGPSVFAGYYNQPELTQKAFDAEGYFNTGDLFSIEGKDGVYNRYLFHGRSKDLIIRGGVNISPEEIENILLSHPAIAEIACVGYPDERLGEKMCAVVVPRPGKTITLEDVILFLVEKDVAVYKRPERIMILDALPRNAVGKVIKADIKKML